MLLRGLGRWEGGRGGRMGRLDGLMRGLEMSMMDALLVF